MADETLNTNINLEQTVSLQLESDQIDANWLRWVAASIGEHFEKYKGEYPLYHEGDERPEIVENFAELRMDGPLIEVPQKGLYWLNYDINILIQSIMSPKDLYNLHRAIGRFAQGIREVIKVYKYGDGPLDDQSLLGCMFLHHTNRSANRGIEINTFGIVAPNERLTQATIEGHYRLELEIRGVFSNGTN